MEKANVKEVIADIIKYNKQSDLHGYGGAVAREVEKVNISYDLKTRTHAFKMGDFGEVAHKMIVEIDFGEAVIQPHSEFNNDIIHTIVEHLANEVCGIYDNQD